jgi:hypothetical protein
MAELEAVDERPASFARTDAWGNPGMDPCAGGTFAVSFLLSAESEPVHLQARSLRMAPWPPTGG